MRFRYLLVFLALNLAACNGSDSSSNPGSIFSDLSAARTDLAAVQEQVAAHEAKLKAQLTAIAVAQSDRDRLLTEAKAAQTARDAANAELVRLRGADGDPCRCGV